MTDLLFYLVISATIALLVGGLWRRGGYLEYPFLAAAVYAGWFLPKAAAVRTDPRLDLSVVLAMALLCLGGIVVGWRLGTARKFNRPPVSVRIERLIWAVVGLTAFATAMRILIELQPAGARALAQWTGPLTILSFFSQVGVVSLAFSLLLFLNRKSPATIAVLGWNLALYAPLLIAFRRAGTGELILAALLALYFVRRISIPRTLIMAGLVVGFLFVHSVGHLRALSGGQLDASGQITWKIPTFEEIAEIDFLSAVPNEENIYGNQVRNASYYMSAIERSGDLTLGAEFWNELVQQYVPGQILGFEFKRSLMIGESLSEVAVRELGFEKRTGTTITGFAQAYRDFWFFGALVFLGTSYWMGRAYSLAIKGDLFSKVFYMSAIMLSLHAITHGSYSLFVKSPLLLVAALLAISMARSSPRSRYPLRLPSERHLKAHMPNGGPMTVGS